MWLICVNFTWQMNGNSVQIFQGVGGWTYVLKRRGKGGELAKHTTTLISDLRHQPTTSITCDPWHDPCPHIWTFQHSALCHCHPHAECAWMWLNVTNKERANSGGNRQRRKKDKGTRRLRHRDGKQLQHSDCCLIKGNVTVLLDFPPTTQCTLLPFDDKIITNSSTQHFPHTHFHALIRTCIKTAASCLLHVHLIYWK